MQQARAMVDIVKRYGWSYVSAIHTEGEPAVLSCVPCSTVKSRLCGARESLLFFLTQNERHVCIVVGRA